MAMASHRSACFTCKKEKLVYACGGCAEKFCLSHLQEHQQILIGQLDGLINEHDQLRANLLERKEHLHNSTLIEQIDQWERTSIETIRRRARECRDTVVGLSRNAIEDVEGRLARFTAQLRAIRQENEVNEVDLLKLTDELTRISRESIHRTHISLRDDAQVLLNNIQVQVDLVNDSEDIRRLDDGRWRQFAAVVAGGHGRGERVNQLSLPSGVFVDEKRNILVADTDNHRIVLWAPQGTTGAIIAGGLGQGSRVDQLNGPTDVLVDQRDHSMIIADRGNRRVVRWFRQNGRRPEILIRDIDCWGVAMGNDGVLYVSDNKKHEVRRWKEGEREGTVVAGGRERGGGADQLNDPRFLFVDDRESIYVAEMGNHRVSKWEADASEGTIVAGAKGKGNRYDQLFCPQGVAVDHRRRICVTDCGNERVVCWREGEREGEVVVGANGRGQQTDQLSYPTGLTFDDQGTLYVADQLNHRVVKFQWPFSNVSS